MSGQLDAVIADNHISIGFVGEIPPMLKTVGPVFMTGTMASPSDIKNPNSWKKSNKGLAAVKAEG
jgi:hypothetical protein